LNLVEKRVQHISEENRFDRLEDVVHDEESCACDLDIADFVVTDVHGFEQHLDALQHKIQVLLDEHQVDLTENRPFRELKGGQVNHNHVLITVTWIGL